MLQRLNYIVQVVWNYIIDVEGIFLKIIIGIPAFTYNSYILVFIYNIYYEVQTFFFYDMKKNKNTHNAYTGKKIKHYSYIISYAD